MDLSQFKTDQTLEQEGTWVTVDGDSRVLIARMGNERYKDMLQRKTKPFRHAIRNSTMKDEVFEGILVEVMAHTILLGWENISDEGKQVIYSPESAKQLLLKYKDFRDLIVGFAQDAALFRKEELEIAAKN
jgi:hypothetical protein